MKQFYRKLRVPCMAQSIYQKVKAQTLVFHRLCVKKYENVISTRLKQSRHLYFLCAEASQALRHKHEFLLLSVAVCAFNWDKERIPVSLMLTHQEEIKYTHQLINSSIMCQKCQRRMRIDVVLDNVEYCDCAEASVNIFDGWEPFMERKDITVWRKQHSEKGMYVYKVFGSYDDVTAEDFLQVQTDTEYRKTWDHTASSLDIIDEDPDPTSHSHIIYWEMLWPKLFANREYIYNRRYIVDEERRIIIIVSRSTAYDKFSVQRGNHRVDEYWSFLVIKPSSGMDSPGLEFVLTYFDDPGVAIPTSISSWVAMNGMPEFLAKLRQAALAYAEIRKLREDNSKPTIYDWQFPDPGMEYPPLHLEHDCSKNVTVDGLVRIIDGEELPSISGIAVAGTDSNLLGSSPGVRGPYRLWSCLYQHSLFE